MANAVLHELGEYALKRDNFFGDSIDEVFLDVSEGLTPEQSEKIKSGPYIEFLASMLQFKEAETDDKLRAAYLVWFGIKYDANSLNPGARARYDAFIDTLREEQVFECAKEKLKNL